MRRRKKESSGILAYGLSIVIGCLLMIGMFAVFILAVQDDNNNYVYDNTTTYTVSTGDTLWDIAQDYSDNRHDTRQVVWEIEQLSGCSAELQPGQTLTIPLYNVLTKQ